MELFEQTRGGSRPSPKRGIQLQGPRPTPLKVNKDSHKLKKPSIPSQQQFPSAPVAASTQRRPPVIIYTVSPKIIHTKPSEFMSLVQRLTGCTASDGPSASFNTDNNNSSAEQSSTTAQNKAAKEGVADELGRLVGGSASTSAPMQPISPNFFSPSVVDINQLNFFHELNVPALHGSKGMMDGGFMSTSPGNFFFSL